MINRLAASGSERLKYRYESLSIDLVAGTIRACIRSHPQQLDSAVPIRLDYNYLLQHLFPGKSPELLLTNHERQLRQ